MTTDTALAVLLLAFASALLLTIGGQVWLRPEPPAVPDDTNEGDTQ